MVPCSMPWQMWHSTSILLVMKVSSGMFRREFLWWQWSGLSVEPQREQWVRSRAFLKRDPSPLHHLRSASSFVWGALTTSPPHARGPLGSVPPW